MTVALRDRMSFAEIVVSLPVNTMVFFAAYGDAALGGV